MRIRSGTAVVLGFIAVLAIGWIGYRTFIPPSWMHAFAADISYRAEPDPDAPPPRDTREAKPKSEVIPHQFICFARLVPLRWDEMIVVPSGGDPAPMLEKAGVSSNDAHEAAVRMHDDPRYQLIVLLAQGKVVSRAWFYTFWGDLSQLAGKTFTPATAAFTARVKDGTHVLTPIPIPPICKEAR